MVNFYIKSKSIYHVYIMYEYISRHSFNKKIYVCHKGVFKKTLTFSASSCWRIWLWKGKRVRKMEKITFAHFISPPCLLRVCYFVLRKFFAGSFAYISCCSFSSTLVNEWKSAHGKPKFKKNQKLDYSVKGNVAENEAGLLYSDRTFSILVCMKN